MAIVITTQRTLWPLKSPNSIKGDGSCLSKEFRCSDLKEKEGGIYTEHIVISFSSVTETATACRSVLGFISR